MDKADARRLVQQPWSRGNRTWKIDPLRRDIAMVTWVIELILYLLIVGICAVHGYQWAIFHATFEFELANLEICDFEHHPN